jgi:hypothetical protein
MKRHQHESKINGMHESSSQEQVSVIFNLLYSIIAKCTVYLNQSLGTMRNMFDNHFQPVMEME